MQIEPHPGHKPLVQGPQQQWTHARTWDPDRLQAARFAGQEMLATAADDGSYDLDYLGFQARKFKTMADAKAAAPEFARTVLARMTSLIAD